MGTKPKVYLQRRRQPCRPLTQRRPLRAVQLPSLSRQQRRIRLLARATGHRDPRTGVRHFHVGKGHAGDGGLLRVYCSERRES